MEEKRTLTAWTKPRPSAVDVARFLRAWLESVITGRPMEQVEGGTIWVGLLTITPDPATLAQERE